jgi:hypothetical protein
MFDRKEYDKNYYLNHKKQKIKSAENWCKLHPEQRKTSDEKYYKNHRTEILAQQKRYSEIHKEQIREYHEGYYQDNKEDIKDCCKNYRETKPEKVKETIKKSNRKYRQTHPEIIRIHDRKHRDKRERGLGYIPLNEPFENSIGHHIDKIYVVNIPKELHLSVPHNVWTGKGMAEINNNVFKWLDDRNIYIPRLPLIRDVNNYV